VAYFGSEGHSSIILAPFHVMGFFATGLALKFVASILLPLTVLLSYPRQVLTAATMQLAWLQFGFAAGYSYLLAETTKTLDGNFVWSGQIGAYLLYVYSTVFALSRRTNGWRNWLCVLAFGLHTISGVLFFLYPSLLGTPVTHDVRKAALVGEVRRALASDPIVGHIPIEVESDGAIVRLTSRQTNAAERARAVEIVSGVDGVRYVEQNMNAEARGVGQAMNYRLSDKVKEALAQDPVVGKIPIDVEAQGDLIRLSSDQTNSEQRERIVRIASAVEGVGAVEDRMK
jgi:osmotically-inducible protein OsmY